MHEQMLEYVKHKLMETGGEWVGRGDFPFRRRSEHIRRVYAWAKRLLSDNDLRDADADAVLAAAIFHDSGYAPGANGREHAALSGDIFAEYARGVGMDEERARKIEDLVRRHSQKRLMREEDTPIELLILMEADLLDETGAMSIVWDCLAEGEGASFVSARDHIARYTCGRQTQNPMITPAARGYWEEKNALSMEFIRQLTRDTEFGI